MNEERYVADLSFESSELPMDIQRHLHRPMRVGTELFELYDRMIGEVHVPTVLGEVAQVVCDTLDSDRASVFLIDRETDELESVAVIGNVVRTIRVPIDHNSLAGFCAKTARAFVVRDAYGDLSAIDDDIVFDRRWDELNHFRTRDVMCAPTMFKGEVMGVVQVVNSKSHPFDDHDLPALETIARLIGYALYHAKLYNDLVTLKKLDQEKAQFMRLMAHELKSPVATSRMLLDMLEDGKNPEHLEMVATRVGVRLDEMLEMIGDLLTLAKVKSGDPMGEVAVLDMVSLVADGCERYRQEAEIKELDFMIELPEGEVPVRMDAQGLKLAVSNLVSNAIKYTHAGTVSVSVSASDSWAELVVTDSGIGIPPEDIPRLFAEFFRASNAKKQKVPGSGVGLAGVKHVVERFGGHIELTSEENEGSTFIIRLPLTSNA